MSKPFNKTSFDDAVFEGRNKDYGAYELRRHYAKRLLIAFGIAIILVAGIILYPKQKEKPEKVYQVQGVTIPPLKKIKTPVLPEKEQRMVEQEQPKSQEKKQTNTIKETINESKLKVTENKKSPDDDEKDKKKQQENTNNSGNTSGGGGASGGGGSSGNSGGEDEISDAESVMLPAIFPGCEKYTDRNKILDCFGNKLNDEIQFYLQNEEWKKKSVEKIYFEIDKAGNITNIKFDGGNKINDVLAIETLRKIAIDFNKRTNPKRRIQPGKNALGTVVKVKYRIPVRLPDPNID